MGLCRFSIVTQNAKLALRYLPYLASEPTLSTGVGNFFSICEMLSIPGSRGGKIHVLDIPMGSGFLFFLFTFTPWHGFVQVR